MPRPFVSILIDTYNHERFISEAVESVLAQDYPADDREILVVDDGSTDQTPQILRKFASCIRVLRKNNGGQASAFNHGIPECRGEIISFLDGDDWWASNKLTRVMEALSAEPDIGIVGHGIVNVQRDGSHVHETLRDGFRFQANTLDGALKLRTRGSFLGTSRMTIRKELLQRVGPVPPAIRIQADEYLFTIAAALAPVRILPDVLTFYRLHGANLFQTAGGEPSKLVAKQKSLHALASSLAQKLHVCGLPKEVALAITALPQASADQLRLALEGGWPWETIRTEWVLYRIAHPDSSFPHRAFRALALLGAALLPPRSYYAARYSITQSRLYRRARQRVLPSPEMNHIQKDPIP